MKSATDSLEKIFMDLSSHSGLKPDQHIHLAESFNEAFSHAKNFDSRESTPWRKEALSAWIRSPKKIKILRILKKQNAEAYEAAKENSPQALEVIQVISTHDGVMGVNCFDEVVVSWVRGHEAFIVDRLFHSEVIEDNDLGAIKRAEMCLERDQLHPSKGKAKFLSDGHILFEKPVAGRTHYLARGVAEKLQPQHHQLELRYQIKKTEIGYEVYSHKMSLMDAIPVVSLNAAIGAVTAIIILQSAPYVAEAVSAQGGQNEIIADSREHVDGISAEDRKYILAAQREFSFVLDKVGGQPGKETIDNPIDARLREELHDALGESILANFSMGDSDVVADYKGHRRNINALQGLLSTTDAIKEAIEKSGMSREEKDDAIMSVKAGEKRARVAYEMLNSKIKKVATNN